MKRSTCQTRTHLKLLVCLMMAIPGFNCKSEGTESNRAGSKTTASQNKGESGIDASQANPEPPKDAPKVSIKTNRGEIIVQLYPERAPKSVANFLDYVKIGFYRDVIFHRVIDGFMIQGGGMTTTYQKKPTNPPVVNESTNGLLNERGTHVYARTRNPNSATSQFFINLVDNAKLNPSKGKAGYTVFGKVIAGLTVVDAIGQTETICPSRERRPCQVPGAPMGLADVPKDQVIIDSVTVLKK